MAMPSFKISKMQFREQYNVVGIFTDKSEIMKQLQTFNSKNQAVAFAVKKKHAPSIEERLDLIEETLSLIVQEVRGIKTRLDNIVKLNNLKETQA